MENKKNFKKALNSFLVCSLFGIIVLCLINFSEYMFYRKMINNKILGIVDTIKNKYPQVTEEEIVTILKSTSYTENHLKNYGYDIDNDEFIDEMKSLNNKYFIIKFSVLISFLGCLLYILLKYNFKIGREVQELIQLVEKINHRNYELELKTYDEGELSILRSEIYKTTIMLKELADNSINDKINLKDSLSDISHQIKTPLTSILIMLDSIIDNEDMEEEIRSKFIKNIKREILNINFLVQTILKLSKFETNTIKFIEENIYVKDILSEAYKNVSTMCDLKNITVEIKGNDEIKIFCDFRWQIEAITNILKNCIEHSNDGSKIIIEYSKNKVYTSISIIDEGIGIDNNDLPHIFERFYRGENSSRDSVGIGLALAKAIIESNNGRIIVDSKRNIGTIFTIKYFRK